MDSQLIEIWKKLSKEDKLAIFGEAGERAGLPATAIEKDWYVALALSIVFSTEFTEHLVFKGGRLTDIKTRTNNLNDRHFGD